MESRQDKLCKHTSKNHRVQYIPNLMNELYRNKWVLYYTAAILLITLVFSQVTKLPFQLNLFTYLDIIIASCCIILFAISVCYYCVLLVKSKTPGHDFLVWLKPLFFPLSRPALFFILLLCINICFSSYTFIKSSIPYLVPFYLDENWHKLDLWLHFDITPWHITHSLFPTPTATLVINVLYNLWFFVKWGVVIFFILYRQDDKLRTQFLVTFLASWVVIGNISATILSSAGPVFMQPLFDVNHYQPLMERLANQNFALLNSNSLPIWALDTQAMLLEHYLQNENSLGSGISAMPSLHVTIATLIAISVSKLNRWGGALAWLYALSIQIGSVHLGWHYAVDGYVGVILTILLWKLVGWLLTRTRLTSDINHHLTN